MKNLPIKKQINITIASKLLVQSMQPLLFMRNCKKEKIADPANIIASPLFLLKVELIKRRTGMVANCEAPLISPLRKMLGNSLSSKRAGQYIKNMRVKNTELSLKKSVLREGYRMISIKEKKLACLSFWT